MQRKTQRKREVKNIAASRTPFCPYSRPRLGFRVGFGDQIFSFSDYLNDTKS